MNLQLFLILTINQAAMYPVRNLSKSPVVFNNKFITILNQGCHEILMINIGPSFLVKKDTGKKSHSLIDNYSPWRSIINEIFAKHPEVDYVSLVNNSYWYTNDFRCRETDLSYPKYIGINGWSIITGLGENIEQVFNDIQSIHDNPYANNGANYLEINSLMMLSSLFMSLSI
ncbi:hypothetical protein CPAV1605_504 [seawater metagenome]|uniref:Uncharacterized protein n=1 Tax=seawater metagenome TaxID=1561972 RepID=A0A5E8CJI1_9ZZZZ